MVFKSGEYKDMGSPLRDMTDREKKIIQGFVNKIHNQFVRDVAKGRQMKPDQVGKLADGRIYTGEEAQRLGLVDRLGNFDDSVEWAGRLGGIKGKIVTVYAREKFSFIKYITESAISEFYNRMINSVPTAGYLYTPSN